MHLDAENKTKSEIILKKDAETIGYINSESKMFFRYENKKIARYNIIEETIDGYLLLEKL